MWVVDTIKHYLEKEDISYQLIELPPFRSLEDAESAAGLPAHALIHAVLLKDQYGLIMTVIPVACDLNPATLKNLLKRDFTELSYEDQKRLFKGWDPSFTPPLGNAYGIKTIIDDHIANQQDIYLGAGDNTHLLKLDIVNFHKLQTNASFVRNICAPKSRINKPAVVQQTIEPDPLPDDPLMLVRQRLKNIGQLPVLPEMAQKILQLNSNPYAHVADLAEVISLDPSLTAQVQRYASSPLYGFGKKIDSNIKAIQVLGYDMVMNLALGLAASKSFQMPKTGPLGLHEYWRHSVHCAAISARLAKALPEKIRPRQGLSYLAGLLHNFGQLLLGHLFPQDFAQVVKAYEQNNRPVHEIELELLGFHHGHLGAVLLEHWGIAEEILTVTQEHHDARYHGPHAGYQRLIFVVDQMLSRYGIGTTQPDVGNLAIVLNALQLSETRTTEIIEEILDNSAPLLNTMAQQLTLAA
ncbi:MAG: hypothetical protein A2V90_00360 [Gammaproteobacteria bacterium RBG_16_57_12]|nr:MAG: hypothetical protein A2V90_00360 [Gammaproteobacteria bacterium RBG_16_57_12]